MSITPDSLAKIISYYGPGHNASDLARALNHPHHDKYQGAFCDCIPSIQTALTQLVREGKVYKIGAYYWRTEAISAAM